MMINTPELTLAHAREIELVNRITLDDDRAHAGELLELVCSVADPKSVKAIEIEKYIYSLTPDFQAHFKDYLARLQAA